MINFSEHEMNEIASLTFADNDDTEIERVVASGMTDCQWVARRLMRIGGLIEHLTMLCEFNDIEEVHDIEVDGIIQNIKNAKEDYELQDLLNRFVTTVAERAFRLGYVQHCAEMMRLR